MSEETTLEGGASAPAPESVSVSDYVAEKREAREAAAKEAEAPVETAESEEIETTAETEETPAAETEVSEEQEIPADQPEEATDEGDEEEEIEASEPIDPPHFWNKEGKEYFTTLDPLTQAIILEHSKHAEAAVSRSQSENAQLAQAVREQEQHYQAKHTQLDTTLELAEAYVATNLNYDDAQLADALISGQITAQDAQDMKLHRDAHKAKLEQLKVEIERVKSEDYQDYVKAEYTKLQELSPELHQNQDTRTDVANYLVKSGYAPEQLKMIGASDMVMAHKAMLWDKSQDKLAKAQPKKAKPPKRVTKPGKKSVNTQSKVKSAQERFKRSGSRDDYVALQRAKREAAA